MTVQKKIIFGLAIIALLGTVTNYVYFSPLLTLLFPLGIYAVNKEKMIRPVVWLYAYLIMFLLSVILYDVYSLFDFSFYRRDGNFIISYAPLLLLPLFSIRFNIDKYIRIFYQFSLALYTIVFVYYLLTTNLTSGLHSSVFGGLFYAQNAVGGFLSILSGLGFAYYYHRRKKKELIYFILLLLMLLATYSRGSIIGLLLGVTGWYLAVNKRFKNLILLICIPILMTIGSLMIGYPFYQSKIHTANMAQVEISEDVDLKNANVLIRLLYTFPRAYHTFKHSPLIGTGVGSYDDRPYDFESVMPFISYNAQSTKSHTDSHAHHSYLHILAEQGIIGLTVFLVFWISLFLYLLNIQKKKLLRDFLLIAYFTITFASFTEHRITTPSMMLPFTISLGLFLAHEEKARIFRVIKYE